MGRTRARAAARAVFLFKEKFKHDDPEHRANKQCFMLHLFLPAVAAPAPSSEYQCTRVFIDFTTS
jgi:hypothetical protein